MWRKFSASVPGSSHIRSNLPCQDAHECILDEKYAIIAVADGLGSAAKAEDGSQLAVAVAVRTVQSTLALWIPQAVEDWNQILLDCFSSVYQALEVLADENGLDLRDYGTTLIVSVICEDWFAVGQVGDGAVVGLYRDNVTLNTSVLSNDDDVFTTQEILQAVSKPQRGEYANETIPITAINAITTMNQFISDVVPNAIAIFTDGIQSLALNLQTGEPYAPFFAPLFEAVLQPQEPTHVADDMSLQLADFLGSDRVCTRTDDDKTLVIVGRQQSGM